MKIKKIISQHRRDFTAEYECEHCGNTEEKCGYDDANFHNNVIPTMKCAACERTAPDNYRALTTRHPEGMQV